jgi:hypothetical protein
MKEMKVINVAQPNAHNIAWNGKNVENRTKNVSFRGTILIYASKTKRQDFFEDQDVHPNDCAFGAIVAIADLVDCIGENEVTSKTDEWFSGPYGYVLENVVPLKEPIVVQPPHGAVIWWTLDGKNLNKCLNQDKGRKLLPLEKVAKKPKIIKFEPNKNLAQIIGEKPLTMNQALRNFVRYCEQNELPYDEEKGTITSDSKLKKAFGEPVIDVRNFKTLIKNNSKEVLS